MKYDVFYRPFRDADADNVVATLMENYHLDYFHESCYDAARLIRDNREGRHLLFVAELADGEFVGMIGGKFHYYFPGSYELAMQVLRLKFQKQGLAKGLLKYCMDCCKAMRVDLYGNCVTYHLITQNMLSQLGTVSSGMWLGRLKNGGSFIREHGHIIRSPKLHTLVVTQRGVTEDAGTLYAPPQHQQYIGHIYQQLGVGYRWGGADAQAEPGISQLALVEDYAENANCDIFFPHPGADVADQLRRIVRERQGLELETFTVFLNMRQPQALQAYYDCLELGFYFTGINPLHGGREYMMLHKPYQEEYLWHELALTEENKAIRDYIIKHLSERGGRI